jgi:threonine synthase
MNTNFHDCGVISRYREYLPVTDATPVISLSEGSTPLIHSPKLSTIMGGEVYLKYEGLNPTGSFKDRGMTMAISKAAEEGAHTVLCASTGNTSASAAAYAARAGMKCAVLLPAGRIAGGKLVQAYIYGATVIAIRGNFDDALRLVRELGETGDFAVVNSINPYRIEGQKTAAFEIIEELGNAPEIHILPVGNAGNITAYWKGYKEFKELGRSFKLPRMLGVQAAGAAPLYRGELVEKPETLATAIRIGRPASWDGAINAVAESHGCFEIVEDSEILAAQKWLAANEGVFAEPASAAPVAALLKCFGKSRTTERCGVCPFQEFKAGGKIVLTITGNGLKDPDTAKHAVTDPLETEATSLAVRDALDQLGG